MYDIHFKASQIIFVLYILELSLSQLIPEPLDDRDSSAFGPRIVNGRPAQLGDVPYQIAFKSRSSWAYYDTFCGGTLIGSNKIISAAHCFVPGRSPCPLYKTKSVKSRTLEKMYAVAGNLYNRARYREQGQWLRLHSGEYPSAYAFPKHDIAVIKTKGYFQFNSYVSPIPYASRHLDYTGNCLASGYGRQSVHLNIKSDKLLLADLGMIPSMTCSRMHRINMQKLICTSGQISDVGKGDSGGPLVCQSTGDPKDRGKGILVGVVSGHRMRVGSFFTRVSSYKGFISAEGSKVKLWPHFKVVIIFLLMNQYP